VQGLLRFEQRPQAVAVDVTHCLRRKLVPSSAAEIYAGLSNLIQNAKDQHACFDAYYDSWIVGDAPAGKAPFNMEIHVVAAS